jgi:NADH-quinone oxidoreductase subunit M
MGFVVLGAAMMTPRRQRRAVHDDRARHHQRHDVLRRRRRLRRAHHRELSRFGGSRRHAVYTGFSTVACFANLGLPGLCGFIGEVMVLSALPGRAIDSILIAASATLPADLHARDHRCFGVILTAGYMLWTIQRVFFGRRKRDTSASPKPTPRVLVLTPLTIMAIALGILPTVFFFIYTNQTVSAMFKLFETSARVASGM